MGSRARRSVFALGVVAAVACRSRGGAVGEAPSVEPSAAPAAPRPSSSTPLTPPAPPAVATDWCIDGLSALDEDVCYVLPPPAEGKPRRLLVYLHGIVPPLPSSAQKTTVETAVLHASVRAGAAALVPRGRRGIGPADARDWWAWPTSPSAHGSLAPQIVARWIAAKKKLESIAGAPFERTYLAGSSNGAYFLSALALRGDLDKLGFPVDGFGAMSGGASGGQSAEAVRKSPARPFYVGFGTYDDETKVNARSLATVVGAAGWPLRVAEHPFGHGAREAYLDEAFAFWDAAPSP